MVMDWNIASAKSEFSEMIRSANDEPQVIYNHKKPSVVVMNFDEFIKYKNLEKLHHLYGGKWSKFVNFSLKQNFKKEIELPSRADRKVQF